MPHVLLCPFLVILCQTVWALVGGTQETAEYWGHTSWDPSKGAWPQHSAVCWLGW